MLLNFADAVRLHQQGDHARARELSARILKTEPRNLQALALHGTTCAMLGDRAEAIKSFRHASNLRPDYAPYHYMLGNLLREGQQWRDSIRHYQQAIHAQPAFIEAWINLGLAFGGCELREQELECYRRALTIDPKNTLALFNLGNTLQNVKRYAEAIECYSRVLAIRPGDANVMFNMANAHLAANSTAEAVAIYERIVSAIPDHAPALANLGVALRQCRRLTEARTRLEQALRVNPENLQTLLTLANVLSDSGELDAAIDCVERAVERDPCMAEAQFNLGNLLHQKKAWRRSCDAFRRASELKSDDARYLGALSGAMAALWEVGGIESVWPAFLKCWSEQPIAIDTILERTDDPDLQRRCARAHANEAEASAKPFVSAHGRGATADVTSRRLRIGYLSPDFGEHPVGLSLVEILERHDRSRFEVIGISLHRHPPGVTQTRIAAACERFIDIDGLDFRNSIDSVRKLDLDLIVDLSGYTENARPAMLAARCAPVQVSYLGYPATMGASWVDYIVADSYVIPEDRALDYAEKWVHIDEGFFPSDSALAARAPSASRGDEGLPADAFVFCSFNKARRITAEIMEAWLFMLGSVDNSVLWLQDANEIVRANMRNFARLRGIDPDRLIFARHRETRADHLARHRCADLFLDTFPYNSQSTARDALREGAPLLTLSGRSFASRVAGSFLSRLRLPQLITDSMHEYKARAIELASNPAALSEICEQLSSPASQALLVNRRQLTVNLECAFTAMIEASRTQKPPANLSIHSGTARWT